MSSVVLRTCAAVAFACFASAFPQAHEDNPAQDRIWLAVEEQPRGELRIEPVAKVDGEHLIPIQANCLSDELTRHEPASNYLQPGTKYALLFGGANAGEGTVGEQDREHTARFAYSGDARIRGQARALATTADSPGFRVASREPATPGERAKALALAREIFSEHGVPEALLPRVRAEYVTRTYLAPSPQPASSGPFFWTRMTTKALHTLCSSSPLKRWRTCKRPLSGVIFPKTEWTRSACVSWTTLTFSAMAATKSLRSSFPSKHSLTAT